MIIGFAVGGSQVGNWTGLGTSGALTVINNLQVGQTIYADNQIKFVTDGSASTPLLTFYNDSTTGLFRDTVSTTGIGVTVGNTEVVAFRPTSFVLNESLNAGTNSISCGSISLSSLSNNSALYVNGTGLFARSVLNNGQILIGSTGHVPVAAKNNRNTK